MKIIYTCLVSVFIFLLSCSQSKEQNKNIVYPKERIKEVLNSFIQENKHENFRYEMFINKIYPNDFNIILYAGEDSLTDENRIQMGKTPNSYTEIDGNKIYIYSGTEYFFRNAENKKKENAPIKHTGKGICWAIRDSSEILSVKKDITDPVNFFYTDYRWLNFTK